MRTIREDKLLQLTFMPRLFPVNCYLVEEENGLTLIDAGMPYSAAGILKAASRLGKEITSIIISHAHDDHVGALDALKNKLPDVPVYIPQREARILTGDRSLQPGEPDLPLRGGIPRGIVTRPDVLLKEGDRIGSLLAISTPGHSPGLMSFFDTRTRALLASDAMQTRGGIAVSGQMRVWFPFPAMSTWNKQAALESVKKLREYSPSLLAVGHGRMLHSPAAAIEQAITAAERNLEAAAGKEGRADVS
ncbi:MBL fold metallo-hydrolase [Paenibacillus sp. FJAT-26967]|uniref:MBL fold metallo-hydrolase n=1 Tax=Paenibacillus sp. FJAT-26967 TaxID=1729690 RepID=UPI00083839A1|nr:MBL fold metallo-hydrolase [Paenibacillus sp. FJAT-26967]